MSMSQREDLDNLLSSFTETSAGLPFFVCLKDYVNFIQETPTIRVLSDILVQQREELENQESEMESAAVKELLAVRDDLLVVVNENGLSKNPQIQDFFHEIEKFLEGKTQSSQMLSDSLDHLLFNICINIPEEKRESLLKKYIDEEPESRNIYGDFYFSDFLKSRRKISEVIDHKRDIELWGDWKRLSLVPKFIEAVNIFDVPLTHGDTHFAFRLINARVEYEKARNDRELAELIPEYRQSVLKIHAFLIRKLTGDNIPIADSIESENLSFDESNSVLQLGNETALIAKSKNTNPHYLLQTIFKDTNKVWSYDEIAEEWGEEYEKKKWLKFYYAGYAVNEKVAMQTTNKQFLDLTNTSVSIRKKKP